MKDTLQTILQNANTAKSAVHTRAQLENFKASFVGPKGSLTEIMKNMGQVSAEERPILGKLINETKKQLEAIFQEKLSHIEQIEITQKLGSAIDPSLPPTGLGLAGRHPLTQVRDSMISAFRKIGFTVATGPEVDTEWYCFDALNLPSEHPARAEQDTYYLPNETQFQNVSKHSNERYLLRAHTSTVQIRTMLATPPPIRIIAPGRVFRRDNPDATHSANFHQVEGLAVDENITVKDLKATLDFFLRELFGQDIQIRYRPSFFPYTEPSYEVDLKSKQLGKLKDTWIEIMGCGMVDPIVFKNVKYDENKWRGYAFGIGIERVAMLLYGIDDIRHFYQNDLRFLEQFQKI